MIRSTLHALPVALVIYAIVHVPAQMSTWTAATRQRWQEPLRRGGGWTRARYLGALVGVRGVGLVSVAIGLRYIYLEAASAGWLVKLAEAAR